MQRHDQAPGPESSTLMWMWGEIKAEFAAVHTAIIGLQRRQDDMRRELLHHVDRLDRGIAEKPKAPSLLARVLQSMTLSNVFQAIAFVWGPLAMIVSHYKPEWIRLLTGH